jgi:UDP-N-acetylglucosamine 2-epimerase (non-hydrolysing)
VTTPIIAVLLGTRPEAVKLAPVICALHDAGIPTAVFSTGQHQDMVTEVLDQFEIRIDEDLALMRAGHTLDHVITGAIAGIGDLLDEYRPRAVLVQGDTSSALGSSLAAFHRGVPIGHVEAGLRSGDLQHPFPEEMNRRAMAVMARWHFAPTETAAANLAAEGIHDGVHMVGNTVVDALQAMMAVPGPLPDDLAEIASRRFILATAHRRESWDGGIGEIARGLAGVLQALPDLSLVFVTHPNPVARAPVEARFKDHPRAIVTGPLPYRVFLELLSRCELAVSDSGGVQEEGPTLGVPVIVTREVTERPEGVHAGAVRVVGTDADRIRESAIEILQNPDSRAAMRNAGAKIYGDGAAASRIAAILSADLGLSS